MDNIAVICLFCIQFLIADCWVFNSDPTYQRWPAKTVPYYFQPGDYNQQEIAIMQGAMQQITSDLGGQFTFVPRNSAVNNGQNFVYISKSGSALSRTPAQTCATFPGMVYNQAGNGQFMAMINGTNGCLGNIREAMRLFVYLIGLRSEHRKPNRETLLTVNNGIITQPAQSTGATAPYTAGQVQYNPGAIDYNSITLLDDQTYTNNPGQNVITSNLGQPIFNNGRLSIQDCQALSFFYSITATCQNPFLNGNIPPANAPNNGGGGPDIG